MPSHNLRLSILEHAPVSAGSPINDAFAHVTKLAQLAEQVGYTRFWTAEHHNMPWLAASAPAILAAHVAAVTSSIRVGTGGIMLSNYSPLAIAEQMGTLEVLHPGRIDMGLGRASGGDNVSVHALGARTTDFSQALAELLAFFHGDFPDEHPYNAIYPVPARDAMPALWLLGSGTYSARLAGELGLPFAHGGHFAGANSAKAIETYREAFRPSRYLDEPYSIVSVQAICAPTDELAARHSGAARFSTVRAMSGAPGFLLPLDEAESSLRGPWSKEVERFVDNVFRYHVVGSPITVKNGINEVSKATGADEIMIATIMHGYQERLESYRLIADTFNA